MESFKIKQEFISSLNNLVKKDYNSKKVWFELYCCYCGDGYDIKKTFKFDTMKVYRNTIQLLYKKEEVISLTPENCEWIGCIHICDKNMVVKVIDYHYMKIDNGQRCYQLF